MLFRFLFAVIIVFVCVDGRKIDRYGLCDVCNCRVKELNCKDRYLGPAERVFKSPIPLPFERYYLSGSGPFTSPFNCFALENAEVIELSDLPCHQVHLLIPCKSVWITTNIICDVGTTTTRAISPKPISHTTMTAPPSRSTEKSTMATPSPSPSPSPPPPPPPPPKTTTTRAPRLKTIISTVTGSTTTATAAAATTTITISQNDSVTPSGTTTKFTPSRTSKPPKTQTWYTPSKAPYPTWRIPIIPPEPEPIEQGGNFTYENTTSTFRMTTIPNSPNSLSHADLNQFYWLFAIPILLCLLLICWYCRRRRRRARPRARASRPRTLPSNLVELIELSNMDDDDDDLLVEPVQFKKLKAKQSPPPSPASGVWRDQHLQVPTETVAQWPRSGWPPNQSFTQPSTSSLPARQRLSMLNKNGRGALKNEP